MQMRHDQGAFNIKSIDLVHHLLQRDVSFGVLTSPPCILYRILFYFFIQQQIHAYFHVNTLEVYALYEALMLL